MKFKPSAQQLDIWRCIKHRDCHIVIEALAGTGKTTTIVEGFRYLTRGTRAAFCCFSKSIANVLQDRVPQGVLACTLHSLGSGAVRRQVKTIRFEQDKTSLLLPAGMDLDQKRAIIKLVSLCKGQLLDGKDEEQLANLAQRYNVEIEGFEVPVFDWVPEILQKSREPVMMDYDDMIWFPIIWDMRLWKYDVLMVDECQDLNRCQQELVMKAGNRLVLVGDRHQSIYGFRGADTDGMERLINQLDQTERGVAVFPLTVTRRCPQTVVNLARTYVPEFECAPDAPIGIVQTNYTADPQRGDMVLCRTNAPLIELAYSLIRNNVPIKLQGRDIGTALANFIKRLVKTSATTSELIDKVIDYRLKETARITRDTRRVSRVEQRLQALNDKCDCVLALCEGLDTVEAVLGRVQAIFQDVQQGDPQGYVLLSSVHRAKGLEAQTVHLINPELLPHPMATQPEELQQERNLTYVAYTRTKENLYIHPAQQPKDHNRAQRP